MPVLSVGELVQATGGQLLRGSAELRAESFAIDSRSLQQRLHFFVDRRRFAELRLVNFTKVVYCRRRPV